MQGDQPLKFCQQRSDLLQYLQEATADYFRAVNELSSLVGSVPFAYFLQRRDMVERALVDAENIRTALVAHRRDHKC